MKTLKIIILAMLVTNLSFSQELEGSPFSVAPRTHTTAISYAESLGFESVRTAGFQAIVWGRIESDGWSINDEIFKDLSDNGLEISTVVLAGNPADLNKLNEYSAFMSSAAERYDGDGVDDANGSPVVTYWEIDNEPDLYEEGETWKGDIEETADYALVLKTAYEAIKSANPDAKVAIAGMAYNLTYYEAILKELEKLKDNPSDEYFDVFNYHYYGSYTNYGREGIEAQGLGQGGPSLPEIKNLLEQYGYSNAEIILTETGTYQGQIEGLDEQSQKEQASSLLKRYAYPILMGVDRVYWFGIEKSGTKYFDKMAFVYDGEKTLAYYTYKLMVEKLEGSDWDNIEIIQESDNVYIYKFVKNNKPIHIAWWDYFDEPNYTTGDTKPITLTGLTGTAVIVTDLVPDYNDGSEVTDYNNAFTVGTYPILDGSVTIDLGENPLLAQSMVLADFDGDDDVDFRDFATFAQSWQQTGDNLAADFNNDGVVEWADLLTFTNNWLLDGTSQVDKIAVTSQLTGDLDIYTLNPDGTEMVNITNTPPSGNDKWGLDADPAWSPDSSQIAFVSSRTGEGEIWVMDADGSNPFDLTNDPIRWDIEPEWNPNGNQIVYISSLSGQEGTAEIFRIDIDGTNKVQLTDNDYTDAYPVFSPNGRMIVFHRDHEEKPIGVCYDPIRGYTTKYANEIYVMDTNGNNVVQLTNDGTKDNGGPSWSPDGTKLVFRTSVGCDDYEIYTMDVGNLMYMDLSALKDKTVGELRNMEELGYLAITQLTNNPDKVDANPSFSPDGTKIVWQSNKAGAVGGTNDLFIMNADGSNVVQTTQTSALEKDPDWMR